MVLAVGAGATSINPGDKVMCGRDGTSESGGMATQVKIGLSIVIVHQCPFGLVLQVEGCGTAPFHFCGVIS